MSEAAAPHPLGGRLRSLDVFRGATIAGMVLVNNAGDWGKTFAPLLHAPWHGWTPTDLVFPFFLFIVGVAIPFALGKRREGPLHATILRRAAILFALGLLLNWYPFYTVTWAKARIPGVLQRIALVYLASALAYIHLSPRARAWLAGGLLGGYWAVMKLFAAPGFPPGDLSAAGNFAGHVDHLLLGLHTWRLAPGPGDPEGLLSTLPAIVSALAGLAVGDWLRSARAPLEKLVGLFVWGNVAIAAGLALDPLFPINKPLWSPSYVVFTTGMALVGLGLAYWAVDVKGDERWQRWLRPFSIFGTNAILVFVGSSLLARQLWVVKLDDGAGGTLSLQAWLYRQLVASWLPDYWASLAWALATVGLWLAVATVLYRRKIFLKV
jgi:predicted acyltransferase